MLKDIRLSLNSDGEYDIIIEYESHNSEFALEFNAIKSIKNNSRKILEFIKSKAKKIKISGVKVVVSGVVIASLAFSSLASVFSAKDRYNMGYLYSGTDQQHIEYVNRTSGVLDVVSPNYFNIQEDGSVTLNYLSESLITTMHSQGIKVVPFLSNHWNRTAGINALKDTELLSDQIAEYVEIYNLDGVNVDIENVTHEQRDSYTELIRLLREKIPEDKEVSVAVAANPNDWQSGWHGSYDYTELAKYADHILIMAYDEHYEGGDSGPVASINFVENSIRYALTKTSAEKIVLGIPLYGRIWSLDNNRIVGKGINIKTINQILQNCSVTVTYDETSKSVKAEFEITQVDADYTVGGDFVLTPGRYVMWYEDDRSYSAKLNLVSKYDIKGAGAWSLGEEDPSIWENYNSWINGSSTENETTGNETIENETTGNTGNQATENNGSEITENVGNIGSEITENVGNIGSETNGNETTGNETIESETTGNTGNEATENNGSEITENAENIGNETNGNAENDTDSAGVSPTQEYITHEVKSGDTLWKISEKYLGSGNLYPQIKTLNNLTSDTIYPGMQLQIALKQEPNTESPTAFTRYTVKSGDTLWKIAKDKLGSGNRYTEIKEINQLIGDYIYTGQTLKIPNK